MDSGFLIWFLPLCLIIFYDFYSSLNIGKIYCKITLDNKKRLLELFINNIIFLIIIGISIYSYTKKHTNGLWIILGSSLIPISIIGDIIHFKNYNSITTKGIYCKNKLIKWAYIKGYTWLDDNSLEINYVDYYDKKYTKIFKKTSISKETLNNIFNNHIILKTS